MSSATDTSKRLMLVLVDPQPIYIESSGRWKWPLNPPHDNDGKCQHVYTASREWWEYVPSGAKPHPWAEGVMLRDDRWYWAIPENQVERCQDYWHLHANRCLLPMHHEGQHWFAVPSEAIETGKEFGPMPESTP